MTNAAGLYHLAIDGSAFSLVLVDRFRFDAKKLSLTAV